MIRENRFSKFFVLIIWGNWLDLAARSESRQVGFGISGNTLDLITGLLYTVHKREIQNGWERHQTSNVGGCSCAGKLNLTETGGGSFFWKVGSKCSCSSSCWLDFSAQTQPISEWLAWAFLKGSQNFLCVSEKRYNGLWKVILRQISWNIHFQTWRFVVGIVCKRHMCSWLPGKTRYRKRTRPIVFCSQLLCFWGHYFIETPLLWQKNIWVFWRSFCLLS